VRPRGVGLVVALVLLAVPAPAHAAVQEPSPEPQPDVQEPSPRPRPHVTARGAVLWDPADQRMLFDLDADMGRPMASTTKIMTTLLALEAGTVEDTVTVSAHAATRGGASLGLRAGQTLPMRSLIAGLMMRSGNDAATAVAEHVDGSEEAFVARMNVRARELGLTQTSFVNASGLTDDPRHRASPLDLARLAHHAMGLPDFAAYAGTVRAAVPGLPPMVTRNELLTLYEGATGVKTGYTNLAGLCLVGSATRDGRTLYAVVLGSDASNPRSSFDDVAALLDHGFHAFRRVDLASVDVDVTRYRWADGDVGLRVTEQLGVTVPADATVTWRTVVPPTVERPIAAGEEVGLVHVVVDGVIRSQVPLVAAEDVGPRGGSAAPAARIGAGVQEALRAFARVHAVDRAA
jgi:D-alanyl-D-alanine carboxypeptidase (penicillin-binding protein 5/6)